jgi:transglutaminase-like putative cysteine protease
MFKRIFKRKPKPQAHALTLAQSWWLFAAAFAALAPLAPHIPAWLTAAAAAGMIWRAGLIWRSGRLPPRWLLFILVVAGCAAVAYSYRGFFGRNPGLALLVIFMALKLLELRSVRDGITVILLACFLLMSGFFFNQSIPATLLTAAALIVVIAALISLQPGPRKNVRKQLQQSALLLAQAVPFMLVLFLLFPRVQGPLWGLPQDAFGASSGLSESMAPGSISQVAQSDNIAFRVRFKGETPPPQQQYWRALTLSNYDGINWSYRPTPERASLPYSAAGKVIDYEITLEPHNQRWLMALEKPGNLPPDSSYSGDGLVLANTPVRSRLRYEMQAYPDFRPAPEESTSRLNAALRLPPNVNPRTRAIAEQWRKQYVNDADILQAATEFFQKQLLAYTLAPPLMRENAVDAFLFDYKRGFCEHFASAYAFALRAAGVPARVIGGYQGGEINPVDGYFTVRQYDAHVWVEAWIRERGWVRIDPTADSAPRRIDGGLRTAVSTEEAPLLTRQNYAWLREIRYRLDAVTNTWNQAVLGFNPQRQREVLNKLGMAEPDWQTMTAWLASLCGLLILGLVLYAMRERTRTDIVSRLWRDFLLRLERKGIQPQGWMGPGTLAQHAAAQLPQHAAAIHAIAAAYVALRYAHEPLPHRRAQQTATLRDLITRFRP